MEWQCPSGTAGQGCKEAAFKTIAHELGTVEVLYNDTQLQQDATQLAPTAVPPNLCP